MKKIITYIVLLLFVCSCRTEDAVLPSTGSQITDPYADVGEIKGFFVLNEGNMGSNKATLDYFDYSSGRYSKNIYAERNPAVVKELGDVGNDLKIYGDRLYAVINCSNLVEVMELSTARHIGSFSIPNCRFITFSGSYGYVSSYVGEVQVGSNSRLGYVAKVDLESLEVVAECAVGYQPEELVVVGDKLYVANSGGYNVPDYDNRVSVIDLKSFELVEHVEVAENLYHMRADDYGYLWISTRGDYAASASDVYIFDTATDSVVGSLGLKSSNMTLSGDRLFVLGDENVTLVDVKSQKIVDEEFVKDDSFAAIKHPYGIAYNREYDELIVTDADDYITPGRLYCYDAEGAQKWLNLPSTGDIPSSITFTTTGLKNIHQ